MKTRITETRLEEMFQELIDDAYGEVQLLGHKYSHSKALKNTDPILYRTAFLEYLDSLIKEGYLEEGKDNSYWWVEEN